MTRNQMLHHAVRLMDGAPQDIYDMCAWVARQHIDGATIDTLRALIEVGPVWDGDLPSKAGRNTLVELGLAAKCVCKGRQGFQVATYRGWSVYHAQIDSENGAGQSIGMQAQTIQATDAKDHPRPWSPDPLSNRA